MRLSRLLLAAAVSIIPASSSAQRNDSSAHSPLVRLFIDCVNTACDHELFQSEVMFVDHVRERQDADVHLLITSQATAAGGREITFSFLGQDRFAARDLVLRQTVVVGQSNDVVRREMVRHITLGLVAYAIESPAVDWLSVTSPERTGFEPPKPDRWNAWTFRTQVSGNGTGERSNRFSNINGSLNASRTTERSKVSVSTSGSYSESSFELPDGRTYTSPNRRYGTSALVVRSIGRRWAAGARASLSSTSFQNIDRAWDVAPALEYNVFPYAESTRRLLTVHYAVGLRSFAYATETVFEKLQERTAAQALSASLTLRQRWGTVGSGVEAASFLPATKRNHATGWGDLELNLIKGLSLTLSGEVTSVRDQVYLPRGTATAEEILVRRRQLETGYQYSYSFGISYAFGSIYSPLVNPRFIRGGF